MKTDYVVVLGQRRHFGDQQNLFGNAPFVDPDGSIFDGEFIFDCPNIDRGQTAVFGGLPKSPARENPKNSGWNSHVLLVDPIRHRLANTGNRLLIVSHNSDGGNTGNRDDFVVDNIVLFYKTRSNPAGIIRNPITPRNFSKG